MNTKINEWNDSYENKDNFIFYPHEHVIRFVSKFIRKRIGLFEFSDRTKNINSEVRVLDLGCGIGRHVIYCSEMGLKTFGIDLSNVAIDFAKKWANHNELNDIKNRILQGDIRKLPWDNNYFQFALSHGVLDSMKFEIAREACVELGRVMSIGGLFYCDLISGDDSNHSKDFSGEEQIISDHEHGTIQLYFNMSKIQLLIQDVFKINEYELVRRKDIISGSYISRYHLVLERI